MAKTSKLNIIREPKIEDIAFTDVERVEEDPILQPPKKIHEEDIEDELQKNIIEDESYISEKKTDTLRIEVSGLGFWGLNEATKPTSLAPELNILSSPTTLHQKKEYYIEGETKENIETESISELFSPLEQKIGDWYELKSLISYDYANPLYSNSINNYPGIDKIIYGDEIVRNLKKVVENCIDKIIIEYPDLIITSAYRSIMLNKMVGGSNDNSNHIKGHSIDFKVKNEHTSYIFNWCINNLPEWCELMWAYPERGNKSWIHISYIEGKNYNQTTLASERDDIHEAYGGERRGSNKQYQEGITNADQNLV